MSWALAFPPYRAARRSASAFEVPEPDAIAVAIVFLIGPERVVSFWRLRASLAEPEGRVPVGHQEEGVADHTIRPAQHPEDEVEKAAG
jgi:hypothetical protein